LSVLPENEEQFWADLLDMGDDLANLTPAARLQAAIRYYAITEGPKSVEAWNEVWALFHDPAFDENNTLKADIWTLFMVHHNRGQYRHTLESG
jgi:hypothetical protein